MSDTERKNEMGASDIAGPKRPKSPDSDIQGSYPAIMRAAKLVRERARINGTPLVYWRDGKVVLEYVPKDEAQENLTTDPN